MGMINNNSNLLTQIIVSKITSLSVCLIIGVTFYVSVGAELKSQPPLMAPPRVFGRLLICSSCGLFQVCSGQCLPKVPQERKSVIGGHDQV